MSLQPSWYPLLSAGSMAEMLGTLSAAQHDGGWDVVGAVHSLDHLPADLRT